MRPPGNERSPALAPSQNMKHPIVASMLHVRIWPGINNNVMHAATPLSLLEMKVNSAT